MDNYGERHVLGGNFGQMIKRLDKIKVGKDLYELIQYRNSIPYGFPEHMETRGTCGWRDEEYSILFKNGKPLSVSSGAETKLQVWVWVTRPFGESNKRSKTLLKLSGDTLIKTEVIRAKDSKVRILFVREYFSWWTSWVTCSYDRHYHPLIVSYDLERKGNHFSINELHGCKGW